MIIKEQCEDFLVDEIPLPDLYSDEQGQHHVYKLKKTNYTTERAVTHIAKALRIPRRHIGFAGTKDKNAITTQYITIAGAKKDRVLGLTLKDLELEFCGYRKEQLGLGELEGNEFHIRVKEVTFRDEVPSSFFVPNYFDEQRFSTHNVEIGTSLLKRDFARAVEIIKENDDDFRDKMSAHLAKQENDYLGALRLLPKKILLFYVHAVQSYVFNEQLKSSVKDLGELKEISYSEGTFLFPVQELTSMEQQIFELIGYESAQGYNGIEPRDFINKSLPELALPGGEREAFFEVKKCELKQDGEEVLISFTLPKGCYATIVLKQLFLQ